MSQCDAKKSRLISYTTASSRLRPQFDHLAAGSALRVTVTELVYVAPRERESVALQVGYKSKKNFYRALQQVTGLTPTEFRGLSDAPAEIVEALRQSLKERT